ncbi:MAG TPA: glycosyltransferase family 2 protein [Solirubrobacteraceae bacterium]|nr:glycosyltransferase family 2 protein [Solirubrobacteraceae bacterium]
MAEGIDVVIVAYNNCELTCNCLRHLQAQTVDHRVIVVDNGSTDQTRARLHSEWPDVQLECFDRNQRFPKACNRGVAAGSGEVVVLLNNDINCRPDFLERLSMPLRDARVGSVASLVLQRDGELIDAVGLSSDATLSAFPRLRGLPAARADGEWPTLMGPGGGAAAYRRSAWEQIGGLDEALLFYMEDVDLALRLRIAGWRSVAEPRAVCVHLGSATLGHRSAAQRRYAGFGRGYMLRRYGLLRRRSAPRTLCTEAIVVLGDLVISHDLAALRGRLAGWRAGRSRPRLALPRGVVDSSIGFRDSLARRRRMYAPAGT